MSTYEISKSSLLSLKAEISRKQQALSKAKAENEVKIKTLKKSPLEIKNKGVETRDKNDQYQEDQDLLKKSKSVLEYKAELYERLSSGKLSEEDKIKNKLYLVRFDKKNNSNNLPPSDSESDKRQSESDNDDYYQSDEDDGKDPGERWVNYVDSFGRTRKCMQKDLEYSKPKDEELRDVVDKENQQLDPTLQEQEISDKTSENTDKVVSESEENLNKSISEQSELMSSDMRRELLRQQWEKEEEDMLNKTDVHYQDILFGEARTHGVGYYGFSKDEEERTKQQEALRKLRKETEEKQKKAQELKNTREKLLAARLKAARNRKRARMGLPPEEDEPEPVIPQPEILEEELIKQKEQEEKEHILEECRKNHIRPWDIGKEGIKEPQVMTQEEWVDKKREERPTEFAPPTNYRKNFRAADTVPTVEPQEGSESLKFSTKTRSKRRKQSVNGFFKSTNLFKNNINESSQELQSNQMEKLERIVQHANARQTSTQQRLDCSLNSSHSYPDDTLLQNHKNIITSSSNHEDSDIDCDDKLLQDYKKGLSSSDNTNSNLNFNDTHLHGSTKNSNSYFDSEKVMSRTHKSSSVDFDDTLLDECEKVMNNINCDVSEKTRKRQGAEVAPPPTYDYYGPSRSKARRGPVKTPNIQDSIEAGLKFLRKQVEDKEKSSKHPDDMFIF